MGFTELWKSTPHLPVWGTEAGSVCSHLVCLCIGQFALVVYNKCSHTMTSKQAQFTLTSGKHDSFLYVTFTFTPSWKHCFYMVQNLPEGKRKEEERTQKPSVKESAHTYLSSLLTCYWPKQDMCQAQGHWVMEVTLLGRDVWASHRKRAWRQ